MFKQIKTIGFDADDTLWYNEKIFRAAEKDFYTLLKDYGTPKKLEKELLAIEVKNMPLYGFGIKAFILSMIETALKVTRGKVSAEIISQILQMCREMLFEPVVLMDGVEEVLAKLSLKYHVILATKGDILDQERKLQKSGLAKYLRHMEIMSGKTADNYLKLTVKLGVAPENFLMIGNSLKSDILPVLEIGGKAIYIPCADNWAFETVDKKELKNKAFAKADKIRDILTLL